MVQPQIKWGMDQEGVTEEYSTSGVQHNRIRINQAIPIKLPNKNNKRKYSFSFNVMSENVHTSGGGWEASAPPKCTKLKLH